MSKLIKFKSQVRGIWRQFTFHWLSFCSHESFEWEITDAIVIDSTRSHHSSCKKKLLWHLEWTKSRIMCVERLNWNFHCEADFTDIKIEHLTLSSQRRVTMITSTMLLFSFYFSRFHHHQRRQKIKSKREFHFSTWTQIADLCTFELCVHNMEKVACSIILYT